MQAHLVQELLEMTAFVFEPSLEGGRAAPQQIGDARQRRRVGQVLLQMAIETKAQAVSDGTPAEFKAIIVMFLNGGADTFNLLVPHSNCSSKDMYAEYETVRGDVALAKADLRPIAVPNGTQPCATFGLHPRLQYMQELYNVGDAAFVANIGSLIEPIDGVVS